MGSNWCLGKVSEPVKLLEHEVATKIWGEMNEGEGRQKTMCQAFGQRIMRKAQRTRQNQKNK